MAGIRWWGAALLTAAGLGAIGMFAVVGGWFGGGYELYDDGPMDFGDEVTVDCLGGLGSSDFTSGSNVIRYSGKEPLTITGVYRGLTGEKYEDSFQLRLLEVRLVPATAHLVGSWPQWPPPNAPKTLKHAVQAKGATMSRDGVTAYNVVAHLTRSKSQRLIVSGGLVVEYTVGGEEYSGFAPAYLGVKSESGACASLPPGGDRLVLPN